ncbi:MAG: hypothetical protein IKO89_04010 [Bacteroidales bacterium]|nr:hypothetical protein [Bacteroidales bacterium]MBR4487710.1 hypothetical protein [Bacteroidales bacterium]
MKKIISLLFIISFSISAYAQTYISMRPNWTFNPPTAENSTYEYYVSKGVGNTEKEARTDAFVIAVKEAQQRVGVGANSSEIFSAFQSNQDFNVIANYYEIPMKEVCSFSEKTRDGSQWYYYQLLQIAINGSITPDFRQFTGDCYDFSKAKELREIMKEEYKEKIEEDKKRQEQEAKTQRQEERKSKRLDNPYCNAGKHRYIAWNIAGASYPWSLISGVEFRYGKIIGFGAYLDLGIDFTRIKYTYKHGYESDGYEYDCSLISDATTKVFFHYAGGLKFYLYKGVFLDFGYGSISKSFVDLGKIEGYYYYDNSHKEKAKNWVYQAHGVLFHAGYNFVTNLTNGAGFFLGISAGASYDVVNYEFAPSIMVKIGVSWGVR